MTWNCGYYKNELASLLWIRVEASVPGSELDRTIFNIKSDRVAVRTDLNPFIYSPLRHPLTPTILRGNIV